MELQFDKSVMPCLRSVIHQVQNLEQTQEVKLTEGMPDIGRILASWGQLLIRGKEWRSGGMSVSGGVMAWVLYAPEDGSEPRCMETWLPVQMKWDFPGTERDGTICISPLLRSVDARSTSARKMMVRAGVGILGQAWISEDMELFTPCQVPEDVQLLKRTYPIQIPKEAGEKAFQLDVDLTLPAAAPALEKIIRYELRPELHESKIVSDKLVFRGVAVVHLLYRGTDGQLHSWDFQVPFSQYATLDREYDIDVNTQMWFAVTDLELEQGAEENLTLNAGITGQYLVYDSPLVEVVEDAYSPNRSVKLQMSELSMPSVVDVRSDTVNPERRVETEPMRVADISFLPDHPRMHIDGEKVQAELSGVFQMLGYDGNDQLQGVLSRWDGDWSMDASGNVAVQADVLPVGTPTASPAADSMQLSAQMRMDSVTMLESGIPMVTGLDLGEVSEPDPNRPSLILRTAGEDTLWDVAKTTGSTVAAIQKANNLKGEPEANQMLLIPIS